MGTFNLIKKSTVVDNSSFNISLTNLCKGVACCLLLFHHLFYENGFQDLYTSLIGNNAVQQIALMFKVCVSIFVILSGYGLFISRQKQIERNGGIEKDSLSFSIKHLYKMMKSYWLIFIIFVPLSIPFGNTLAAKFSYDSTVEAVAKVLIDFFGLSRLFFPEQTNTFNSSWWFMSAIIVCYILFPLIYKVIQKDWKWTMPIALFCYFTKIPFFFRVSVWLIPFMIGMLLAKFDILNKFVSSSNDRKTKLNAFLWSSVLLIFCAIVRFELQMQFDTFFALSIILFCITAISKIKYINSFFVFCGKHSGNIYMFHILILFIIKDELFSLKYPLLIFIALLAICLVISIFLQKILQFFDFVSQKCLKKFVK